MGTLSLVLTIILLVVSVLLIVTVLVQKTKSGGMGSAFGGDTQSFTSKGKAASREAKLQKLTIALAIVLGVLAILLAVVNG